MWKDWKKKRLFITFTFLGVKSRIFRNKRQLWRWQRKHNSKRTENELERNQKQQQQQWREEQNKTKDFDKRKHCDLEEIVEWICKIKQFKVQYKCWKLMNPHLVVWYIVLFRWYFCILSYFIFSDHFWLLAVEICIFEIADITVNIRITKIIIIIMANKRKIYTKRTNEIRFIYYNHGFCSFAHRVYLKTHFLSFNYNIKLNWMRFCMCIFILIRSHY